MLLARNTFLKWLLGIVLSLAVAALLGYAYFYHYTHRFDGLILAQARVHELDPRLVKTLIYEESFFDPRARSDAGAHGLMQITPIVVREWSTAKGYVDVQTALNREFEAQIRTRNLTLEGLLFDPEVNLQLGCWYLKLLMTRYSGQPLQLPLALAGYNAGPSNAERWLKRDRVTNESNLAQSTDDYLNRIDFPVTRDYVRHILLRYDAYKRANREL